MQVRHEKETERAFLNLTTELAQTRKLSIQSKHSTASTTHRNTKRQEGQFLQAENSFVALTLPPENGGISPEKTRSLGVTALRRLFSEMDSISPFHFEVAHPKAANLP